MTGDARAGSPPARVLVAGIPRSGTTWVGRVLGHAEGARYVHEPDNHLVRPEAWWAKRELGAYPHLIPGQAEPEYERLFAAAFAGGAKRPSLRYTSARLLHRCVPRRERRSLGGRPAALALLRGLAGHGSEPRSSRRETGATAPGVTVVKSIFCARALEWLADRFEPEVVVVTRHPFAVIGSWAELGWSAFLDIDPAAVAQCRDEFGVEPPPPESGWLERAAWHFGFLSSLLGRTLARHPEWHVLGHEPLCADPEAGFADLCDRLGLQFGVEARSFLLASNRPGRGYSTKRVWSEQTSGGRRLDPAQQERVTEILSRFPTARPVVTTHARPGPNEGRSNGGGPGGTPGPTGKLEEPARRRRAVPVRP